MCKMRMIWLLCFASVFPVLCVCVNIYMYRVVRVSAHVYFVRTLSYTNVKNGFAKAELIQNRTECYWRIVNPETKDYCSFCPSKVKFIDVIVLMISIPMSDPLTEFRLLSATRSS